MSEVSIPWPFSGMFMPAPLSEPVVRFVISTLQEAGVGARHYSAARELTDAGHTSSYVHHDDVFVVDATQEALARATLEAILDERAPDGLTEAVRALVFPG